MIALMRSASAQDPTAPREPIATLIDAKIKEALVDREFSNDDAVAVAIYVTELFLGPRREYSTLVSRVTSAEGEAVEAEALYDDLKVSGYRVKFFRSTERNRAFITTITRVFHEG